VCVLTVRICNLVCRLFCLARCLCASLTVWLDGNALVSINEVTERRARLVPGWVTVVLGQVNHLSTEPGQLSLGHLSMGRRSEY